MKTAVWTRGPARTQSRRATTVVAGREVGLSATRTLEQVRNIPGIGSTDTLGGMGTVRRADITTRIIDPVK